MVTPAAAWDDDDVDVYAQLLELQTIDLSIERLRHRRSTLPELAALAANDAEIAGVRASRSGVDAERTELTRRQHVLEDEINQVRSRAETHEANLYSGSVTNPRELQALQDDIASLQRRQRSLEDDDLELMELLEPLTESLAAADARITELEATGVDLQAAVDAAAADIDAQLGTELARRDEVVAGIDTAAVADYEDLRTQFGGIAVARLEGGNCGGCHLTLSAVEQDRIRRLPADSRIVCEECGRLLVR